MKVGPTKLDYIDTCSSVSISLIKEIDKKIYLTVKSWGGWNASDIQDMEGNTTVRAFWRDMKDNSKLKRGRN